MAFIAGSLIIPASYIVTDGNPMVLSSGSIFESLPMVFTYMPFGLYMGAAFFVLLTFAALTSNICALEVMVSALKDKFGVSRTKGVVLMALYTLVIAIPIVLGYGVLGWIDLGGIKLLEIFVPVCILIILGYSLTSFL